MSTNEKIRTLVNKVAATLETGIRRIVEQEVKTAVRQTISDQKNGAKKATGGGAKPVGKAAPVRRGKKTGYPSDSDGSTDSD